MSNINLFLISSDTSPNTSSKRNHKVKKTDKIQLAVKRQLSSPSRAPSTPPSSVKIKAKEGGPKPASQLQIFSNKDLIADRKLDDAEITKRIEEMKKGSELPKLRPCDYFLETLLTSLDEIRTHPKMQIQVLAAPPGTPYKDKYKCNLNNCTLPEMMCLFQKNLIELFHLIDRKNPLQNYAKMLNLFFKDIKPRWEGHLRLFQEQEKEIYALACIQKFHAHFSLLEQILAAPHTHLKNFGKFTEEPNLICTPLQAIFGSPTFEMYAQLIKRTPHIVELYSQRLKSLQSALTSMKDLTPELSEAKNRILRLLAHLDSQNIESLFLLYTQLQDSSEFVTLKRHLKLFLQKKPTSWQYSLIIKNQTAIKQKYDQIFTLYNAFVNSPNAVAAFDEISVFITLMLKDEALAKLNANPCLELSNFVDHTSHPFNLYVLPLVNKLNYLTQTLILSVEYCEQLNQAAAKCHDFLRSHHPSLESRFLSFIDLSQLFFWMRFSEIFHDKDVFQKEQFKGIFSRIEELRESITQSSYLFHILVPELKKPSLTEKEFVEETAKLYDVLYKSSQSVHAVLRGFPKTPSDSENKVQRALEETCELIDLLVQLASYQAAGFGALCEPVGSKTKLAHAEIALFSDWISYYKQFFFTLDTAALDSRFDELVKGVCPPLLRDSEVDLFVIETTHNFKKFLKKLNCARKDFQTYFPEIQPFKNVLSAEEALRNLDTFHEKYTASIFDEFFVEQLEENISILGKIVQKEKQAAWLILKIHESTKLAYQTFSRPIEEWSLYENKPGKSLKPSAHKIEMAASSTEVLGASSTTETSEVTPDFEIDENLPIFSADVRDPEERIFGLFFKLNNTGMDPVDLNGNVLQMRIRKSQIFSGLKNMAYYFGLIQELTDLNEDLSCKTTLCWALNIPHLFLEQMQKAFLAYSPLSLDNKTHCLFQTREGAHLRPYRSSHNVEELQNLCEKHPALSSNSNNNNTSLYSLRHATIRSRYPYFVGSDTTEFPSFLANPEEAKKNAKKSMDISLDLLQTFTTFVDPSFKPQPLDFPFTIQVSASSQEDTHPLIQSIKILQAPLETKKPIQIANESLQDLQLRQQLLTCCHKNLSYSLKIANELLLLKNPMKIPETSALGLVTSSALILENSIHICASLLPLASSKSAKKHYLFDSEHIFAEDQEYHNTADFPQKLKKLLGKRADFSSQTIFQELTGILKADTRYPSQGWGEISEILINIHSLCETKRSLQKGWYTRKMTGASETIIDSMVQERLNDLRKWAENLCSLSIQLLRICSEV